MHGAGKTRKLETKSMKEYGWYAHLVQDDCACPNHFNAHTHGLLETFGHTDLQCCMPMDGNILMHIWHQIVDITIRKSKLLRTDYDYFIFDTNGYAVRFINATECGRPVLRMIIPNKFGKYEGPMFADQLTMLEHNP
jgi:hypothetical protein